MSYHLGVSSAGAELNKTFTVGVVCNLDGFIVGWEVIINKKYFILIDKHVDRCKKYEPTTNNMRKKFYLFSMEVEIKTVVLQILLSQKF